VTEPLLAGMGKEEEARVRRGPMRSAAAKERRPARMTEALKCMVVGGV
jgi:hypothetical protein